MTDAAVTTASPASLDTGAVVIGTAAGTDGVTPVRGAEPVDEALGGRLRQVLADLGATGKAGDGARFATLGALRAPSVLAVGVGEEASRYDAEALRRAAGAAVRALAGTTHVATTLALANGAPGEDEVRAVTEGSLLGAYTFDAYCSSPDPRRAPVRSVSVVVPPGDEPVASAVLHRAAVVARSVALVRDLVNTPASDLSPARLAQRAAEEAHPAGVQVVVLDEEALAELGFGGILGVGAGSARPPRLVRLGWRPDGATRTVALVGKGITFDSGGLSLKPAASMEWMKTDMAGAATVLGAVLAAARLQLPVAVTGWLALAENLPSGTAIRPSDILTMYGGKRVEVLNTDAEGRLVLGDALTRAVEESPDLVVDVATLTGAQVVALGARTAGVMGRDAARQRLVAAAGRAGEAVWPMPLPPELRKNLDSSVADLANVAAGGNRDGGMLVAAHFLAEFVPDGVAWAHLDIAGPAWNGGEPHGYTPKGGTGMAVRTLVQLLEDEATGG
ncbi:MAG TPA: leucyl aminopeptidase [Frankiaceae bacterium]|nr:leucyl aminopeptidase [Frankiaceae bacterium]